MQSELEGDPTAFLPSILDVRGPPTRGLDAILNPVKPARPGIASAAVPADTMSPAEQLERDEALWANLITRLIRSQPRALIPGQIMKPSQDNSELQSDSDDMGDDASGHSTPSGSGSESDDTPW
ncbi:MAG: hypothetical protein Q8P67_04315 [archaeon]|nr:hypothetical protein [archaeon]